MSSPFLRRFEPMPEGFILRRIVKKRIRAIMLLSALLCPVGSTLAAGFSSSLCCCCDGGMCPMHHKQSNRYENGGCQGHDPSSKTCMCRKSQPPQSFLLHFVPEAILKANPSALRPRVTSRLVTRSTYDLLTRATSPPASLLASNRRIQIGKQGNPSDEEASCLHVS